MILDGFKFSINFFTQNYIKLLSILLLPLMLEFMLSISISSLAFSDESIAEGLRSASSVIIQTWVQCIIVLCLVNRQSPRAVSDLYIYSLYKLPIVILITLILGIATVLGLILFIIPGIYLAIRFVFFIFEILLSSKKNSEALQNAFQMTEGRVFEIFIYLLPLTILFLIFAILIFSFTDLLIIELLFSYLWITFSFIYIFYFYDQIKTDNYES